MSTVRKGIFAAMFGFFAAMLPRHRLAEKTTHHITPKRRARRVSKATPHRASGSPSGVPKCMRAWRRKHGVAEFAGWKAAV